LIRTAGCGKQKLGHLVPKPKDNVPAHFYDRAEAGRFLARELGRYAGRNDVLVLALPRGGVPVGFQVASELRVPLDVFLVRKLGVPGHEELAMGAIASGGVRVLNDEVIRRNAISHEVIERVSARERIELQRRELAYRRNTSPHDFKGKTIILVDDGIATGSTMCAAIAALRKSELARIIVGAPTAPASCQEDLGPDVDELVVVTKPEPFYSVGQVYDLFDQTSDEEVRSLLARSEQQLHA
jgi:putative phosphoribosyl transferase